MLLYHVRNIFFDDTLEVFLNEFCYYSAEFVILPPFILNLLLYVWDWLLFL